MKKALSFMVMGALASATVFMMFNSGKTVNDLKKTKDQMVGKFKAMM